MQTDNEQTQHARDATAELRQARQFLVKPTPESLNQCYPWLEQAVGSLRSLEASLRQSTPANPTVLRKQVLTLQREVVEVSAMLQSVANFYQSWSRRLTVACSGYTPHGVPTPPPRQRRTAWEA